VARTADKPYAIVGLFTNSKRAQVASVVIEMKQKRESVREIWLDGRSVVPIAMHLHALPIENYLLPTISCGVGYCVNQHLSPALSHGSADVAARAAVSSRRIQGRPQDFS